MQGFLSKSLSSMNNNKLNGVLAEVSLRDHIERLGFGDRISPGGWIARCDSRGDKDFAAETVVMFPEKLFINQDYSRTNGFPSPPLGLHTICSTFHQIGIKSYYCVAKSATHESDDVLQWYSMQLGLPRAGDYELFPDSIEGFATRQRRYNYLRYKTDATVIPVDHTPSEYAKESLRVAFSNKYFSEVSDLDAVFWGERHTYPVEIKEKTAATKSGVGEYFGLDIGPFVKLAYYAAKRGNLHSLFVVREIDDRESRNLVDWWYVTFETLAQFASWNFIGGGTNMGGGASATVPIPKSAFTPLNRNTLAAL